ncbi:hypothetical protein [Streptomyces sp. NPDC051546]|uniref:hypothetical protein n=1 Tax=Streptomyces sp. NPDC051546 TaxID=3365655 RepID=UPI00379CD280
MAIALVMITAPSLMSTRGSGAASADLRLETTDASWLGVESGAGARQMGMIGTGVGDKRQQSAAS